MMGDGLQFVQLLSENATLSTVQGTIVSQSGDVLILDTGSGQVRVMIPSEWTVGSEVLSGAALFNGTFASSGQTLTVDVLKSHLFSNANFSVNVIYYSNYRLLPSAYYEYFDQLDHRFTRAIYNEMSIRHQKTQFERFLKEIDII
jgi:hypothetical protein